VSETKTAKKVNYALAQAAYAAMRAAVVSDPSERQLYLELRDSWIERANYLQVTEAKKLEPVIDRSEDSTPSAPLSSSH
jgi:hypothetical protein